VFIEVATNTCLLSVLAVASYVPWVGPTTILVHTISAGSRDRCIIW
jgi:hypothetical protein